MKRALVYGILGSLFFAFTFVFNRSMNISGGYWLWSACLRYIFTLPIMLGMVMQRGNISAVHEAIRRAPIRWLIWSTVGFGLFYAPLTMSSVYGESWFISATWQITIVCGIICTPLFGKKIPVKGLLWSVVILAGIALLQTTHLSEESAVTAGEMMTALALIVLAAFSYPLGNRKMMAICPPEVDSISRVYGMTLCSMPFWLLLSGYALMTNGVPSEGQLVQSFIVALFSGVVATVLFFAATDMVRHDPRQLAVIEATQSGEVIFTLIGGIMFLGDPMPTLGGFLGIAIIVLGMIGNSLSSAQ